MEPKYGNVTVALAGQDGNAFAIMSRVSKALRNEGVPNEEVEAYLSESMSGDYDSLLRTAMKWVNVT
jgi:hypothetical protein